MAKKWHKLNFGEELALGTLAPLTVIEDNVIDDLATERVHISSAMVMASVSGLAGGEGPVQVGFAISDWTVAEIAEKLAQSSNGWSRSDLASQEEIQRKGIVTFGAVTGDTGSGDNVIGDGDYVKVWLNFDLAIGQTISMFAYNTMSGSLTTGGELTMAGHFNYRYTNP